MEELRRVAVESLAYCQAHNITDWASIKAKVKSNLSGYLFKTTKRSPMILPVIMEI
jgi:ribonuclease J